MPDCEICSEPLDAERNSDFLHGNPVHVRCHELYQQLLNTPARKDYYRNAAKTVVARTRAEQGLPRRVEDTATLEEIAALTAAGLPLLPSAVMDGAMPGRDARTSYGTKESLDD
jgi:hypothetical protein